MRVAIKDRILPMPADRVQRIKDAIKDAIASSGKNKGMLKAKAPKMGTDASIAWNALQMNANPYKVGIASLMFLDTDGQELFEDILELTQPFDLRKLDRDRVLLDTMGIF